MSIHPGVVKLPNMGPQNRIDRANTQPGVSGWLCWEEASLVIILPDQEWTHHEYNIYIYLYLFIYIYMCVWIILNLYDAYEVHPPQLPGPVTCITCSASFCE